MSKRNDPVGRARSRTAPVKKPFPLGFVLGSAVLAVALIGILVYAVQNQGVGDTSSLKYAESQVDGLEIDHDQARNHVQGAVSYPGGESVPPTGGDHSGEAQSCQVYTETIPNERAVHSLEHGAAWIVYDPKKVTGKDLEKLTEKVEGNPYRMLSPYPGLKQPIALQAWGERVFVDSVGDKRVDQFLKLFTNGPQTPEKGAACTGSSSTGPVGTTPLPGQSTMPSSAQASASSTPS
jgi:hypothetical protein